MIKNTILIFVMLLFSFSGKAQYSIKADTTRGNIHGLYEIQQEGKKFIKQWNLSHHTKFELGEINLKTLVCRCKVPLKTTWMDKSKGRHGLNVEVICTKTNCEYEKKWSVPIPVLIKKYKK